MFEPINLASGYEILGLQRTLTGGCWECVLR